MRLAVLPTGLLQAAAMGLGQVPTPLVKTVWGMGEARCLIAATRLGTFEALADGGRTAAEVAETTGCDPVAMGTLLNALNGFGVVRRKGQPPAYLLTRQARKWLVKGGKRSLHNALSFMGDLWDQMNDLEEVVRTGEVRRIHEAGLPPEFWERYMWGLADLGRFIAPFVARLLPLGSSPERLLDVGGGHGLFSAACCARHAGLTAEVLDLPEAAAVGRRIVADVPGGDRVVYREADFRTADWGEGYDLVLIFNVLHNATGEEAEAAITKAHASLRPGGLLVVQDSEHREHRRNLSTVAGFNELLFFLLSGAGAWPEATMHGWIEAAGFVGLKTRRLPAIPSVLISARRR